MHLIKVYRSLRKKYMMILSTISPMLVSEIQYKKAFRRKLNLKNPQRINEKLMWLKLNTYSDNSIVTRCSDKYAVREYLIDQGCGDYLNELIGVWDRAEDIDWASLPEKFAIKCNHGCGYNIICIDKNGFDTKKATKKLSAWLKEDYWKIHAELNYRGITRKIICEKFISGKDGKLPVDYKIYCFNGQPMYIGNFIERNLEEHTIIRGYFDNHWNYLPICRNEIDVSRFPHPAKLDEMLGLAEKLARPFPFVRVDFYECGDKVLFGELTFTPTGCLGTYYTEEAQVKLGNDLKLK